MTPRERVCRAVHFQETDIVPYQVGFTAEAFRKLAEYYGDPNFHTRIQGHFAMFPCRYSDPWIEVAPGHFQDEWGVIWNRAIDKDIGTVENRVIAEPTLDDYRFPEIKLAGAADMYRGFVEAHPDVYRVACIGFSLFERAWTLRGMDQLLMDMIESPEFVHELLDRITEFNLAQVDTAIEFDIDALYFGDDWGCQRGLIMGPKLWREFIKPCIARMYSRVREAGKFVLIHSCGDVKEVLPDLVEIGLNIFNPFQPEVMDVFETKKRYYGKLSFFGGISVQRLLPYGTPDEVRRETRKLLKILGEGGGYIAAPSHSIPSDAPPENMAAMIEVLQNQ